MQSTKIKSEEILSGLESHSKSLAPEARYYLARHLPRYWMLTTLDALGRSSVGGTRILDVGMGYETLLLEALFPTSAIDCLGLDEDSRYLPRKSPYRFIRLDLNDLAALEASTPPSPEGYGLIVCMEVVEHLVTPPEIVFRYFAKQLAPGGMLLVTTPNAAWMKNRLKLLCGKNPFELLRENRMNMGHIREYTLQELVAALHAAGLVKVMTQRRGLYAFAGAKDRLYSRIADRLHPSLRRSLIALFAKPQPGR